MIIKGLAAEVTDFVHHGGSSHRKTESQVKPPVIWNIKPVGFPVDGQSREFQLPFQYQSLQECLLGSLKPNDSFHLLHFPILENRHVLRWAASSTGLPFPNFFPWSFPFSAAGQLRKSGQSLGKNICIINSSKLYQVFLSLWSWSSLLFSVIFPLSRSWQEAALWAAYLTTNPLVSCPVSSGFPKYWTALGRMWFPLICTILSLWELYSILLGILNMQSNNPINLSLEEESVYHLKGCIASPQRILASNVKLSYEVKVLGWFSRESGCNFPDALGSGTSV